MQDKGRNLNDISPGGEGYKDCVVCTRKIIKKSSPLPVSGDENYSVQWPGCNPEEAFRHQREHVQDPVVYHQYSCD